MISNQNSVKDEFLQEPLSSCASDIVYPQENLLYVTPCSLASNATSSMKTNMLVEEVRKCSLSEPRIPDIVGIEDRKLPIECEEIIDERTGILEAVTREYKNDYVVEHDSYIFNESQNPCSHEKSPELIKFCACIYDNHSKLHVYKIFERMVVDAFVYHKYSKSHKYLST